MPVDEIDIHADAGQPNVDALFARAREAKHRLHDETSEVRRPIVFEFAGSPKSGKTSIIGILSHFLRRGGFRVGQPAEGASLRTPPDLKDDLLAFNAWSACYAIQTLLQDAHAGEPDDILLLDRGVFDAICWMRLLESREQRLTPQDRATIERFLLLDFWRERVGRVFLFIADPDTSMERESDSKIVPSAMALGRAMNPDFLGPLVSNYRDAADALADQFSLSVVDTSFRGGRKVDFRLVATKVAMSMLDFIDSQTTQRLLVTDPFRSEGFVTEPTIVDSFLRSIEEHPRYMDRGEAESTDKVQQVVPYGFLRRQDGRLLCLRRNSNGDRRELAGKWTILVGGHAEEKDARPGTEASVFERCLRREITEELIGLELLRVRRIGVINDGRNQTGMRHVAIVHEVEIGGGAAIRRQTHDREFGREGVRWIEPSELQNLAADLDPWSQLVAERLFSVTLPDRDAGATLFR